MELLTLSFPHDYILSAINAFNYTYRMAGKFGREFCLAVWRIMSACAAPNYFPPIVNSVCHCNAVSIYIYSSANHLKPDRPQVPSQERGSGDFAQKPWSSLKVHFLGRNQGA